MWGGHLSGLFLQCLGATRASEPSIPLRSCRSVFAVCNLNGTVSYAAPNEVPTKKVLFVEVQSHQGEWSKPRNKKRGAVPTVAMVQRSALRHCTRVHACVVERGFPIDSGGVINKGPPMQ